MANWLRLKSQTAIITGAASGIGRATAIAFAEQGCNLLLADSRPEKLDEVAKACLAADATNSILVQASLCDVADGAQVRDAITCADDVASMAQSSSSSVASVLVNCAGITRDGRVDTMSDADWYDVMNVNLRGTFLTCQAFCGRERLSELLLGDADAAMSDDQSIRPKSGMGGSIVNIGSVVSTYGNYGQVNYGASKGGVLGLTMSLAKEMASLSLKTTGADDGVEDNGADAEEERIVPPTVRVNCIQPGFIRTPMVDAVPEKVLSDVTSKIALRRLGRAEDVANLATFLASSERAGYITGEAFECSGMLRL